MDTKTYIDLILNLIKSTKLDSKKLRLVIYLLIGFFSTPTLSFLLEKNDCWEVCRKLSPWLSFNNLPFNQSIFISVLWLIGWTTLFIFIDLILFSYIPFIGIRLWQYINRYINGAGHYVYKLNIKKWPSEWILQGGIRMEVSKSSEIQLPELVVSFSNSGCLLKNGFFNLPKKWKNLEMSFDLYFPYHLTGEDNNQETRALGIIFRAQDLENYYMIQLRTWCQDSYKVLLKPHVRILGNWEVFDIQEKDLITTTTFDSKTDPLHVTLEVKDLFADVYVRKEKECEDTHVYRWALPSNTEVNTIQHLGNNDPSNSGFVPRIPFRERYGMIGFRAYPGEFSIVRNLSIKSI